MQLLTQGLLFEEIYSLQIFHLLIYQLNISHFSLVFGEIKTYFFFSSGSYDKKIDLLKTQKVTEA